MLLQLSLIQREVAKTQSSGGSSQTFPSTMCPAWPNLTEFKFPDGRPGPEVPGRSSGVRKSSGGAGAAWPPDCACCEKVGSVSSSGSQQLGTVLAVAGLGAGEGGGGSGCMEGSTRSPDAVGEAACSGAPVAVTPVGVVGPLAVCGRLRRCVWLRAKARDCRARAMTSSNRLACSSSAWALFLLASASAGPMVFTWPWKARETACMLA
mmetsp:Transcript_35508/g.113361  ORF Transcript_35508/g.113361 Transcript_35508/m.113361 type:complete len:208 (+) Transcript_35508:65-688(+)